MFHFKRVVGSSESNSHSEDADGEVSTKFTHPQKRLRAISRTTVFEQQQPHMGKLSGHYNDHI